MKITIISTVFILFFFSCRSKERTEIRSNRDIVNETTSRESTKNHLHQKQVDTLKIYNDEFMLRVLENDLTLSNIIRVYNSTTPQKQLIANSAQPSLNDTLVTFINGNDKIVFHKGGGNIVLEEMKIESQALILDGNIHIGVSKSFMEQKFNTTTLPDLFKVQDTEGGNIFTFGFNGNSLVQIVFDVVYF